MTGVAIERGIKDWGNEIALGNVSGSSLSVKFGRNSDVDTGTPEDVWEGGGDYTGFDATANEEMAVVSTDVNDTGSDVTTGTATGGSETTLINTGDTFVTDGVAVGDCLVNITQGIHGIITSIDSETQVTVHRMVNGNPNDTVSNTSGDSYKIVTATSTGAALLRCTQVLNANYAEQTPVYITLNGTTTVTTSGINAFRCTRGEIILAGSTGDNEGTVTCNQATTTANVFFAIQPNYGQTTVGALTVPAEKFFLIKRVRVGLTRATGAAGSATVSFKKRQIGEAWRSIRVFEVSNADSVEFTSLGGDYIPEKTDIKLRVDQVSSNNTIIEGAWEYYEQAM